VKKNDIVKFKFGATGGTHQGKVNWVDEENVGITLIGEGFSGQEATVMSISECEVVIEFKGDSLKDEIHNLSTEELISNIQRLKGMRFPKKMTRGIRTASLSEGKRQRMTKLLESIEEDPKLLDMLIAQALKEEGDSNVKK
jgi:hypothetical protein